METLPDYLDYNLDIIFVGLNPSIPSVRVGHYFGNPRNRFWTVLNLSGLLPVHISMEQDHSLLQYGIGLTDLVKRPTPQASGLTAADYRAGAPVLREKLVRFKPRIVCFHGVTCYRQFLVHGEATRLHREGTKLVPGPQEKSIGSSQVFVTPNPSPANAQYSVEGLAGWYRELGKFLAELPPTYPHSLGGKGLEGNGTNYCSSVPQPPERGASTPAGLLKPLSFFGFPDGY